jgi:hypothetical protein
MKASSQMAPEFPNFVPCSLTIQFDNLDDLKFLWHCLNVTKKDIVQKSQTTTHIINSEYVTGNFQIWNEVDALLNKQKQLYS